MNHPPEQKPDRTMTGLKSPWWEPYVFTGGILILFVAFLIACSVFGDFLDRTPFGWTAWLGLFTVAGIFDFFRKPERMPSATWPLLISLFFGVTAFTYHANADRWFGAWHAVLAGLFICLAVKSAILRYRLRRERLHRS